MSAVQNCTWLDSAEKLERDKVQMLVQTSFHLLVLGKVLVLAWFCSSLFALCVYNLWLFLISLRVKFSKVIHRASNKSYSCLSVLTFWCFL